MNAPKEADGWAAGFARLLVATGLPPPEFEFVFAPPRRWRFDLSWPSLLVAFEREGNTWAVGKSRHTTGMGYRKDVEKYNAAAILGWAVVRATPDMMRDGSAVLAVKDAIEARLTEANARG